MKKLFALALLSGALAYGPSAGYAQDDTSAAAMADSAMAQADSAAMTTEEPEPAEVAAATADTDVDLPEDKNFHEVLKEKFIQGDVTFMTPVLLVLILGLAIAIQRIIVLSMSTTNTKKLLARVEDALNTGGIEAAKEVTRNERGPVASIFTQGMMRSSEGIDMVEKSIVSYGSVEMGRLERGLVWLSLFIALAPMLGFMGTVIGMIGAFDAIAAAGDVSPGLVASGIQVALITTVAGLIVAIILQIFYNYCVSKVDSLVNQMEDASISLVDLLVRHKMSTEIKSTTV